MPCVKVWLSTGFLDQLHHGVLELLIKEFEKEANLVQFLCGKFTLSNSERPSTRALQPLPHALKVSITRLSSKVEKI